MSKSQTTIKRSAKGVSPVVREVVSSPVISRPEFGRIGQLAEVLRCAGRAVTGELRISPIGGRYVYLGSVEAVDDLVSALDELERFQAGWV